MTSVSAEFLSVDPYLKNAFSSDEEDEEDSVSFDISHKSGESNALQGGRQKDVGEAEDIDVQASPPKEWELDVRPPVSTKKWLQSYGLHKYRLTMDQILPAIGFKLADDFDPTLKRPVSSRYSQGLFQQIFGPDGKTFNITCSRDKLAQLKKRLTQALTLYQRRLEWLTSESRRIFGVVEEKAVTIVMDVRNMSPEQFHQYRSALQRVLREQFQHVTKFNLIRAAEDIQLYNSECIPLSHDTLENAIQWIWALDRLASVSSTACAEAVLTAMMDNHNEAVYLFTEGTSIDCCRQILLEKVKSVKRKIPVHVVSFNCDSSDTIKFLRNFATVTGGRFHAYAVVMEMDAYEPLPTDPLTSKANILLKRRTFGGIPPGAGVRDDVVRLYEEMEEARTNLQQLEIMIERTPEPARSMTDQSTKSEKAETEEKDEQYMSSKQWLQIYGLAARKLNLYDVLCGVSFKHQDGVVEILERPDGEQTDAVGHEKLINARYCDRFPVVRWKDGRAVHVQVTPEVHRNYEQRMQVALKCIQQRVDWLQQGSRALFGTVVEEEIYILIDTSASMQHSIQFVKERLFVLMQEQLRHKAKFNMIAFNSKVVCWRDRMVEVTERSLKSAWTWVQGLTCWGSTNTYAAVQTALADPYAQAVYLLTDGRPDQPPRTIIAQVQMQKRVPVHTISFNCHDSDANQFLYDLAQATEGRYHYFSDNGTPPDQPDAWESQDMKELKDEMSRGLEWLDQLEQLRDQCTSLSWKKEVELLKQSSKAASMAPARVPPLECSPLFRPNSPARPSSAPPPAFTTHALPQRPSSAAGLRPTRSLGLPRRPQSAKAAQHLVRSSHKGRKLVAAGAKKRPTCRPMRGKAVPAPSIPVGGHTRTSLLRTMNSTGRFSPNEWLLPETSRLFEQQAERRRQLAESTDQNTKHRGRRQQPAKLYESSKLWLKKQGLVAKRLTILDALAPTLVPHRSKYIPILDKHVLSRVFDEVFPIAHVSGAGKNRVHLVNPSAVNLKEYEEKLEKALNKYRQRLNTIVWNALPEDVRKEYGTEEPVPFCDHRGKFLQVLSEEGWPVAESDIAVLEQEIERGEKFLQQSRDLRRAASDAASDALSEVSSPGSLRRSHSNVDQSVDRVLHVEDDQIATAPTTPRVGSTPRTPHPPDDRSPTPSETHTPRPPDSPAPQSPLSPSHRSVSINTPRVSVKVSARESTTSTLPVRNSTPRSAKKNTPRNNDSNNRKKVGRGVKTTGGRGRVMVSTLRGTRVVARNDKDGLYYPGKVSRCPNVRHATVEFCDGEREVLTRFIIPVSGAVACPPLQVGDYALVQVVNLEQAAECYAPCIVQFTPQCRQAQAQFYTVMLYNGQKVTTRRIHLVKISKERFELSARYIAAVQGEDRKKVEDKVYVSGNRKKSRERKQGRRRSRSSSESRSRSPVISPMRPRSPTPGIGLRETPSPPRSASISPTASHRLELKIVGRKDEERSRNSERRVESRSRSRSQSGSPDRRDRLQGKSRSLTRSRSGSRSPSSSPDRKSGTKSSKRRSGSSSDGSIHIEVQQTVRSGKRSRSASRSRSRSRSRSWSKSRSRSRSTSRSKSPEEPLTERQKELKRLKKQLQEQQDQQASEWRRMKRKMKKLKRRLRDKESGEKEDQQREEQTEEEEGPIVTPRLLQLRRTLPELQPAEEVLARFSDDGWYYRGTVQQNLGDLSYIVEDATGYVERIWREDIISDYDDKAPALTDEDRVVALHLSHSSSYAPGVVQSVDEMLQTVTVQFYDGQTGSVARAEVYRLPRDKYNHDVLHIQLRQRGMLGLSVVARDDTTGQYFPGKVLEVEEGGQQYVLRWSEGSQSKQLPVHIFSAMTRRQRLLIGDRVLAMADPDKVAFLPGQIIGAQDGALVVRFCDGQVRDDVNPLFCYWVSQGYFEEASYFWKICQPDFGRKL